FFPSVAASSAARGRRKASALMAGATLPHAAEMGAERTLDALAPRRLAGEREERLGIAVVAERRAGFVEAAAPGEGRRRGPGCPVAVPGAQLRAERDQLRQVGHGGHVLEGRDADEPV